MRLSGISPSNAAFFCGSASVAALIGVAQFVGQFVFGADIAFFLDKHLPENVTVSGYNSLIPLYWDSPVYKSNGVFFLEPSFLSQYMAVAIILELLFFSNWKRVVLYAAAMFASFSGTGMVLAPRGAGPGADPYPGAARHRLPQGMADLRRAAGTRGPSR